MLLRSTLILLALPFIVWGQQTPVIGGGGSGPHSILSDTHTDTSPATLVAGDILFVNGSGDLTRLAKGTDGEVLKLVTGEPDWVTEGGGTTHDVLSATHPDTTPAAVTRGAIITGQGATPTWSTLVVGGSGNYLRSDGTDVAWSNLLDADLPANFTAKTMLGDLTFDDGAGDSPSATFAGATGTSWSMFVADADDDFRVEVATAATENYEFINTGTGLMDVLIETSDGVLTSLTSTAHVTSGTFADARISASSVTQHEAALTITESQISDLAHTAQRTQEEIEDFAGGMWTGNTETGATITYQDIDGTIDFVIDNLESLPGTLDVGSGGTGANLSGTGGANQVVKQTSLGGAFTVALLVDADVPDTITLTNITQITNRAITDTTGDLPASRVDDGGVAATQALFSGAGGAAGFRAIADGDIPDTITASNYLLLAGGTLTGNVSFDDGAGDSPTLSFAPATGTVWTFTAIDTDDDLRLTVATAATENYELINTGTGLLEVLIETSDGVLTSLRSANHIVTDTLADARVDGSLEADELVLAGDVDGAANANDLDELAVEAELEAVLDLPDLQGQADHGSQLTGLTDDDHTQYALLAGRASGQTLVGGTAASEDLILESTSNATKGEVIATSRLDIYNDLTLRIWDADETNYIEWYGGGARTTDIRLSLGNITGPCTGANGGALTLNGTAPNLTLDCEDDDGGAGSNAFGTIGAATADAASDTITVTDSATIDFTTTNDPEDLTAVFLPAGVGTATWLDNADRTWTFDIAAAGVNPTLAFAASSIEADAHFTIDNEQEIRLKEGDAGGENYLGFKSPATVTANGVCTLNDSTTDIIPDTCVAGILADELINLSSETTGQADHGTQLTGLTDDDHTQYALLAGRSGGQSLIGGTAASNNLTLESTSNATKGIIILEDNVEIDDQNSIRLREEDANGDNYFGMQSVASRTANYTVLWAVTGDCTGNTNAGALTINASNEIVCSDDDGGAGGSGDAIEIEDGDDAGTFTAIDTTARFDDSGDINFAFTDGGAGGPDTVTATVRADSVALTTDTTGNYVGSVADGTGIDGTASGEGAAYTPVLDLSEINDDTWGDNTDALIQLTFDPSGATQNPRIDAADSILDLIATNVRSNGNEIADATDNLGFFAATTSAQFFGAISDEQGSGPVVGATSPQLTTPTFVTSITQSGDSADAGALRLQNNQQICWEASPAGVDVCIEYDASEQFQIDGTMADAAIDGSLEADELVLAGDVSGAANANTVDDVQAATANTEAADNNTTQVATTAFVQQEINGAGGTSLTCASGVCNVDDDFMRNNGDTITGDLTYSDGVGDSPANIFAPQTGTNWNIFVVDSDDDLALRSNTASTENVDVINDGAGVANLTVEGEASAATLNIPATGWTSANHAHAAANSGGQIAIGNTTGDLAASRVDDGGVAATQALFSGAGGAAGFRAIADGDIPDTITASNYLLLAGGTLTGELVTDNLGIEFEDSDTNPSCIAGKYSIYADLSETTLKKCLNGVVSDLDTTAAGSGDAIEVEDGDNAGTFTAIDTTARFEDQGDINFTFADGGAGGPDTVTATVRADSVALTTDTTGNYLASCTNGLGITGCVASEGGTPTLAFITSDTLAGNPGLGAEEVVFSLDGTGGGLIWEGLTADAIEGLLVWNPTTSDRTLTLPDATDTLMGRATTDTLTNKTLDSEGTGNTVTTVHYIQPVLAGCQGSTAVLGINTPTANAPAAACVTGTNTQRAVLDFDATTDESIQFNFQLPFDWTGNIDLEGVWHAAATTGDVEWAVQTACVDDAETGDPAFNAEQFISDTSKGTANQFNDFSQTALTTTGCTAGDTIFIKFYRNADDGVDDDMTGDARLAALRSKLRRAQ